MSDGVNNLDQETYFQLILTFIISSCLALNIFDVWLQGTACFRYILLEINLFAGIDTAALIGQKDSPFRLILLGLVVSAQMMFMYAKKEDVKDPEASSNSTNHLCTVRVTPYNLRVLKGEVPIFTPKMTMSEKEAQFV